MNTINWSQFAELNSIFKAIRTTNSIPEKEAILAKHKDAPYLQDVLYYTLNPMMKYNLTASSLKKATVNEMNVRGGSPFDMLDELSKRNMTNQLRDEVKTYIEMCVPLDCQEIVQMMVLKDLKIKMGAKTINKVIPKLIPVFEVALANPYKKKDSKTKQYKTATFKKDEWVSISLKLNGVRAVYLDGKFYTRTGHVISGMKHIGEQLEQLCEMMGWKHSIMFDGELLINNVDCYGNLIRPDDVNFRESTGLVNRKDRSVEDDLRFEFVIFDTISKGEFLQGRGKLNYKLRSKVLDELSMKIDSSEDLDAIRIVPVFYQGVYAPERVEEVLAMTDELGFEGAMINRDAVYECKRSSNLLKVKSFFYNDLRVIGVYQGEEGKEFEDTLGGIIVNYKGYEVKCGSGMNKDVRDAWWANPELIIGKIVTIKTKGESENKEDDSLSMQFPILVGVRYDKDEESYES